MLKKMTAVLVAVLMLVAGSAMAETAISVSGEGSVLVSADHATVSLGITARNKDVQQAQQQANQAIASIRASLKENGIAEEDINTGMINIYANYDYSSENEMISGYTANATLAIRLSDTALAGQVIDLAFAAGANTLEGISFYAEDTEAAKKEALEKAVADARQKAEILAAAMGMTISSVKTIQEGAVYSFDSGVNNFSKERVEMEADTATGATTVVQAAKISVQANITIVFEAE